MGKHHKKRNPATAPSVLMGGIAIVLSVGMLGNAMTLDFEDNRPHQDSAPVVRSPRPSLSVASGAAGGQTERLAVVSAPRPTRSASVSRSRTAESLPSSPVRDRSTSAPRRRSHPSPTPAPATSSAQPASDPTTEPAPEASCQRGDR